MDDITKSIAQDVESGKYFKDSLEWYNHRYLSIYYERFLYLIIAALIFFSIIMIIINYYNLFPLSKNSNYTVYKNYDDIIYERKIISYDDKYTDGQIRLLRKLVENYVKLYEKYDYSEINQQFQNLYSMSDKKIFDKFYNDMNLENPLSPLHFYGRNRKKIIYVTSIELIKNIDDRTAKVTVTAISQGPDIDPIRENKNIIMTFKVPDLEKLSNSDNYNFLVTNYESVIINNIQQNSPAS